MDSKISNLTQLLLDNQDTEEAISHEMRRLLRLELETLKELRRDRKYLEISLTGIQNNIKIRSLGDLYMTFQLQDSQEVVLTAVVLDSDGKPATLVNTPTWSVPDATVVNLTANGLTATLVPVSTGNVTVTFAVDGVTGTFAVSVTGGPAASVTITAGTPTAIPAPTPAAPTEPTTPAA